MAAKSGLNKSILDQGWSEFGRQLDYESQWRQGRYIKVDAKYTSQKCAVCQHISKKNRRSQASFICMNCGHQDNADTNVAKNILAAGHVGLACEASASADLVKQKPLRNSNLSQPNLIRNPLPLGG